MDAKKEYFIEVTSPYKKFWRYNVAIMCGAFSAGGERTGFVATEDRIAEVGDTSASHPARAPKQRCVTLKVPAADYLILYVYIIPHTLPTGNDIAATTPFPLSIGVSVAGKTLHSETRQINQWSGASIELRIEAPSL